MVYLKKKLTTKKLLLMGVIVGASVIILSYLTLFAQHKRTLNASIEGTLPRMKELSITDILTEDSEGVCHYTLEQQGDVRPGNRRAWTRLVYSEEGKKQYLIKRLQNNMFTIGFDRLQERTILYEFKCSKNPVEYAIVEVFEIDNQGKTLDYGKTGSSKDWEAVPEGSAIYELAQKTCPPQNK